MHYFQTFPITYFVHLAPFLCVMMSPMVGDRDVRRRAGWGGGVVQGRVHIGKRTDLVYLIVDWILEDEA